MKQMLPYSILLPCILYCLTWNLSAQCPFPESGNLFHEDFETGLPQDWEASATTDGGSWQVDDGKIGVYTNPGEGNWIYVNDESTDKVGQAYLMAPWIILSEEQQYLELEFDINFQEFEGQGKASVEMLVEGESDWLTLYEFDEDLEARVSIDITPFISNRNFRIRFFFDDEGAWGWGMGIDNLRVGGTGATCGNGICEAGENPENCPGDCPGLSDPSPEWVPVGQDLSGNPVSYQTFKGGTLCDDCSEKVEPGFDIQFFGKTYQEFFINSNGNLSFNAPLESFTPEAFCLEGPSLIAPFFADVDLSRGGSISYYVDPERHYVIVSWVEVGYFGCEAPCDMTNTFQAILTDGSLRVVRGQILPFETNIIFNYGDMQWTAGNSSGGIDGLGGVPATVGVNEGNGNDCMDYGLFDRPGFEYYGNMMKDECSSNSVSHLDFRSIHFCGDLGSMTEYTDTLMLTGELVDDMISLRWETDRIDSTEFFLIERKNAELFEDLDVVYPAEGEYEFEFVDTEPLPTSNVYRVIRVKIDGRTGQSDEVEFSLSDGTIAEGILSLNAIGPNPFENQLMLRYQLAEAGQTRYQLSDMSGRVVYEGTHEGLQGGNMVNIQTPDLPRGMYIFNLYYGQEHTHFNLIHQ